MFRIIDSPTSRTFCEICLQKINKGERRLDANLGTGNYEKHYHPLCFTNDYFETLQELVSFRRTHTHD